MSNARDRDAELDWAKSLIKLHLGTSFLTKNEIVDDLFANYSVDREITETAWQSLETEDRTLFTQYYAKVANQKLHSEQYDSTFDSQSFSKDLAKTMSEYKSCLHYDPTLPTPNGSQSSSSSPFAPGLPVNFQQYNQNMLENAQPSTQQVPINMGGHSVTSDIPQYSILDPYYSNWDISQYLGQHVSPSGLSGLVYPGVPSSELRAPFPETSAMLQKHYGSPALRTDAISQGRGRQPALSAPRSPVNWRQTNRSLLNALAPIVRQLRLQQGPSNMQQGSGLLGTTGNQPRLFGAIPGRCGSSDIRADVPACPGQSQFLYKRPTNIFNENDFYQFRILSTPPPSTNNNKGPATANSQHQEPLFAPGPSISWPRINSLLDQNLVAPFVRPWMQQDLSNTRGSSDVLGPAISSNLPTTYQETNISQNASDYYILDYPGLLEAGPGKFGSSDMRSETSGEAILAPGPSSNWRDINSLLDQTPVAPNIVRPGMQQDTDISSNLATTHGANISQNASDYYNLDYPGLMGAGPGNFGSSDIRPDVTASHGNFRNLNKAYQNIPNSTGKSPPGLNPFLSGQNQYQPKLPTTIIEVDENNFHDVVHKYTGFPAPDLSTSPPLTNNNTRPYYCQYSVGTFLAPGQPTDTQTMSNSGEFIIQQSTRNGLSDVPEHITSSINAATTHGKNTSQNISGASIAANTQARIQHQGGANNGGADIIDVSSDSD